jgi:uncharacterized protein (TIGR02246 family)
MRLVRVLSALVVVMAVGLRAEAPPISAGDADAVKALVGRYAAAREIRDPAAIDALFTEDADQLVSTGTWRRGRDTLVKGMLESSERNPGGRTLTVEAVRLLAPGVALADARYEIAAHGTAPARRMWSTFVVVRHASDWRIAAIRNMLPAE